MRNVLSKGERKAGVPIRSPRFRSDLSLSLSVCPLSLIVLFQSKPPETSLEARASATVVLTGFSQVHDETNLNVFVVFFNREIFNI